ncbi:hypothetical protein GGTG_09124 [Gaeumannomyces tritici R3-111a-1]|uniref:Glutamine amidotransferase type-2 domain-containing protein n=1 Tax=Gaeumannomyces tritici (strain R3-111a-1) TaxID=644352 RepID=J3P6I3_GAET3|nr:hypothetical protein GGTG_09124 [Gaeumannomyces tritici R3-111a-1]EJT72258.1 hypothetical protein GGTG_09124 [Gaeumannomyces tritici R3-111a-1]
MEVSWITGTQSTTYAALHFKSIHQAAAKLRHRGPDAEGVWLAPGGGVGLGHSRLSIVDLSHGGDQPLHSNDGRVHAVVNGEIYDHDAIRARLARDHGCVFGGTSDSEVALALYKVYGAPAFLEHMRGEFAFVIHDERDGRTIAGRDRFGIKPLFWTITGSGGGGRRLLLASECKAFLPLGWEPEWDVLSLFDASAMNGDKFVFKGVRKILPGYWMEVDKHGEIKHHEYWDINYRDKREVETRTVEEMIERVRERLIEAVRLRLRADVPVGIYLSGGIDSSAIAGIVAKLVREEGVKLGTRDPTERISCFSIKFPSASGFGESERTAEWLGVSIEKIDMDEAALARHFADAVYHNEHHHWDLNTVGKFALPTLPRRSGVPVVVTGEGADELFAGYPFLLPDSFTDADGAMPHTALAREGELRVQIQRLMASGMADILAAKGFFADRGDAAAAPRFYLGAVKMSFGPRGQQQQQQQRQEEVEEVVVDAAASKSSWWGSLLEGLGEDQGAKLAGWELTEKWILREAARPFLTPEPAWSGVDCSMESVETGVGVGEAGRLSCFVLQENFACLVLILVARGSVGANSNALATQICITKRRPGQGAPSPAPWQMPSKIAEMSGRVLARRWPDPASFGVGMPPRLTRPPVFSPLAAAFEPLGSLKPLS